MEEIRTDVNKHVQNPPFTKDQAEEFFSALFFGKHHIPSEVRPYGLGWKVNAHASLATYDFDTLTRLVFLAHDRCVRVEIVQGGPGRVGVVIWRRAGRFGDIYSRHPSIEQALLLWREKHPQSEVVI